MVVAAEGRFAETRRLMGIGAHMRDFGRSMLVCHMKHERRTGRLRGNGSTTARPWSCCRSSAVLSVPHALVQSLKEQLDGEVFARAMRGHF